MRTGREGWSSGRGCCEVFYSWFRGIAAIEGQYVGLINMMKILEA